jgi:RNA polymerase sigma factor (sigma-70 family)
MLELTEQQIVDAKLNDLEAVTAVITATEARVTFLANQAATLGSRFDADLAEDLAQTGRIAVWEAIDRFKGTDVAQFAEFIDVTLRGVMANTRKSETRQGVSRRAAADFETAIALAGGDPYEAEKVAQDAAAMGDRKMSREGAYAARMAWQGTDSLDVPVSGEAGATVTVGELIAGSLGIPEDLLTERDVETHRQRVIRDRVHGTLDKLSSRMGTVLRQDYAIGDVRYYGDQVGEADGEMAEDMGLSTYQVQQARTKGRVRFRELYLKGAAA